MRYRLLGTNKDGTRGVMGGARDVTDAKALADILCVNTQDVVIQRLVGIAPGFAFTEIQNPNYESCVWVIPTQGENLAVAL
jgi:hypothetical protein